MWALDSLITLKTDPLKDPLGYQEMVENIGSVIPGAYFGNPDLGLSMVQRVVGGGTLGQMAEFAMDSMGVLGSHSGGFAPVNTLLGQPDREIDRSRAMSALMATDTELLNDLLAAEDPNQIELMLLEVAHSADESAARDNILETAIRFGLPTNTKFSGDLDTIFDVWVEAGQNFGATFGVDPNFDIDNAEPLERRKYADSVRGAFFKLPQEERDRLIVEQPNLAVNLISSWTWTDKAETEGVGNTERAYRTDGSREGLARHQILVNGGWIRPLAPIERARRIVGLQLNAREATAKRVYESVAENVNDVLWETQVLPADKAVLEAVFNRLPEAMAAVDIRTTRELWENWGRYELDFETFIAELAGIPAIRGISTKKADRTGFDNLRRGIRIETPPWNPAWPGQNPENLTKSFKNQLILENMMDENVQKLAGTMGIELTPNMRGEQLYNDVQRVIVDQNTVLKQFVDPAYQAYIGSRSVDSQAARDAMTSIEYNTRLDPNFRQQVSEFTDFAESIGDRYRQAPLGVPGPEQTTVRDRFMRLLVTSTSIVSEGQWQLIWDQQYKRAYGELDWTPPEPRSPREENGDLRTEVWQPVIDTLVDGDSMKVVDTVGDRRGHEVRLLGVRARDYGLDDEGAQADKDRLWDWLTQAVDSGGRIYLVRDPDGFGRTDPFGRELAWLWHEDADGNLESFYFAEEMLPNRDPSGGDVARDQFLPEVLEPVAGVN
jgi:hypothetical protein